MIRRLWVLTALLVALAAPAHAQFGPHPGNPGGGPSPTPYPTPSPGGPQPIQHIVVIVQENRSVDNLFNGFPGMNTVTSWPVDGTVENLAQISLATRCDPGHSHAAFVREFNNGLMDGWGGGTTMCGGGETLPNGDYAYVDPAETAIYRAFCAEYMCADGMFQSNQGPSFPAHQYLIAGQSGGWSTVDRWAFAENSSGGNPTFGFGSVCSDNSQLTVTQINLASNYPGQEGNDAFPCKDYTTIFDLARLGNLNWAYYAYSPTHIWTAPNSIAHLWLSGQQAIIPETTVLTDIASNNLANVVYVTPTKENSDHPHGNAQNPTDGPCWVGTVINAIGNSPYWNSTAILVTWDDWGGWFDHVHPPTPPWPTDPHEYGFRVPFMVVSPYVATVGGVDHTTRSQAAIISYIESNWNLGSLGTLDAYTDDLQDMFNYQRTPLAFQPADLTGCTIHESTPDNVIDGDG